MDSFKVSQTLHLDFRKQSKPSELKWMGWDSWVDRSGIIDQVYERDDQRTILFMKLILHFIFYYKSHFSYPQEARFLEKKNYFLKSS